MYGRKDFIESPYSIPVSEAELKEFIKQIPKSPGVYKFLDTYGNPLYIGKAKLLNKKFLHILENLLDQKK